MNNIIKSVMFLVIVLVMTNSVMADSEIESRLQNVDGVLTWEFGETSQVLNCDNNFDIVSITNFDVDINSSTFIEGSELNNTLASVVNRETSVLFMNQQQWFLETFIPLTADMNTMNSTISSLGANYQSCTEFLSNERDKLQLWNQTWNTQLDSCQSDKSSIMWFVGIVMTLIVVIILATYFVKPEFIDKIFKKKNI